MKRILNTFKKNVRFCERVQIHKTTVRLLNLLYVVSVHGLGLGFAKRDEMERTRQMAPPMSAKPKWDRNLILDKTKWPQKPEAFTVSLQSYSNVPMLSYMRFRH
jgi:hypothetical protein